MKVKLNKKEIKDIINALEEWDSKYFGKTIKKLEKLRERMFTRSD